MKDQDHDYGLTVHEVADRRIRLSISGRIDLNSLTSLNRELETLRAGSPFNEMVTDLSDVKYMDSAGAMVLLRFEDSIKAKGIPFQFVHVSDRVRGIMNLLDTKTLDIPPLLQEKASEGFFPLVGEAAVGFNQDLTRIMIFVGELLTAMMHAVLHPLAVRWDAVFFYMKRVGVDGLPIVSLISLLIGVILAFMSSLQLKQFGATTYVAPLVGFAMVRELGPLMTAILVAGRSGSAFSAEIGSMMISEEIDALTTMGFDPVHFLVLPKVLAAIMVVPILTIYAAVFGILGGLMVGVIGLGLTPGTFMQQIMGSFNIFDIVSTLIKSIVFAVLIAGITCQRGFQVRGGAEAVGAATTSAVVSAIFLIVLANSAFAIILYYIH